MTTAQPEAGGQAQGRRALFGWSPPDLPADTCGAAVTPTAWSQAPAGWR